jgi:hypothetical protein
MAGPIQIVIVGGGFVACTARGAWNAACRGGDAEVTVVNSENYMLYMPLLPGRRRAWSNPATWSCRCGGCWAPRACVWAPSPRSTWTPGPVPTGGRAATSRCSAGTAWWSLPGRSAAWFLSRAWPSTPADAANLGRRLRVGLDWAVAVALPRAIVELGSLGRTGPLAAKGAGASRAFRSAADAGRPPPPLGPGRSVTGADQAITVEDQRPVVVGGRDRGKGRPRSAMPAR